MWTTAVNSVSGLSVLGDTNCCVDGGFFVFGDLSVKTEGEFRLRFSLFEMLKSVPIQAAPLTWPNC